MKPKFKRFVHSRSGLETKIRADLDARKVVYEYETVKLKYHFACCPHCGVVLATRNYIPDFIFRGKVALLDVYVEAKGWFTSKDRTKMIAVKETYPALDIRLVFQSDNKLSPKSKSRYSDWALKHEFPFIVGESIPQSWIPKCHSGNKETPLPIISGEKSTGRKRKKKA